MATPVQDLQQIKGIGEILAKRLCETGIDSFATITKAGEAGLKAVKGVNPRIIQSIIEQAARLQVETVSGKAEQIAKVKKSCTTLRASVQAIAESARQRLGKTITGKPGDKLTTTLVRFVDTLDKVEDSAHKRLKRTGKALAKAEQRLKSLVDAGHKDLRKGLKKARKSLGRAQR